MDIYNGYTKEQFEEALKIVKACAGCQGDDICYLQLRYPNTEAGLACDSECYYKNKNMTKILHKVYETKKKLEIFRNNQR